MGAATVPGLEWKLGVRVRGGQDAGDGGRSRFRRDGPDVRSRLLGHAAEVALQARDGPLPAHVHARRAGGERLDRGGRHGPARAVRRGRQAGGRRAAVPVGAAGDPDRPARRRHAHALRRARQRARLVHAKNIGS